LIVQPESTKNEIFLFLENKKTGEDQRRGRGGKKKKKKRRVRKVVRIPISGRERSQYMNSKEMARNGIISKCSIEHTRKQLFPTKNEKRRKKMNIFHTRRSFKAIKILPQLHFHWWTNHQPLLYNQWRRKKKSQKKKKKSQKKKKKEERRMILLGSDNHSLIFESW
jgi:hypothetical protein